MNGSATTIRNKSRNVHWSTIKREMNQEDLVLLHLKILKMLLMPRKMLLVLMFTVISKFIILVMIHKL